MKTNPITTEQYSSYTAYNRSEEIKKLANRESQYFWARDFKVVEIPKYNGKVEVVKLSGGVLNMVRMFLP